MKNSTKIRHMSHFCPDLQCEEEFSDIILDDACGMMFHDIHDW